MLWTQKARLGVGTWKWKVHLLICTPTCTKVISKVQFFKLMSPSLSGQFCPILESDIFHSFLGKWTDLPMVDMDADLKLATTNWVLAWDFVEKNTRIKGTFFLLCLLCRANSNALGSLLLCLGRITVLLPQAHYHTDLYAIPCMHLHGLGYQELSLRMNQSIKKSAWQQEVIMSIHSTTVSNTSNAQWNTKPRLPFKR